jgi:4-hydroxybenzoate polyprenyltransferase/phosphoserine phosphatase
VVERSTANRRPAGQAHLRNIAAFIIALRNIEAFRIIAAIAKRDQISGQKPMSKTDAATHAAIEPNVFVGGVPLIVDLDRALLRSDLLVESFFAAIGTDYRRIPSLLSALARGKAAYNAIIAECATVNAALLPYDPDVLKMVDIARSEGRPVYLVSASDESYVSTIAAHLGRFHGWFASNDNRNLSSTAKAQLLVQEFGEGNFDYIGSGHADLAVWRAARCRIAVHPSRSVRPNLLAIDPTAVVVEPRAGRLKAWVKLIRCHQWAKNGLVFVPLLTAQRFDLISIGQATLAFSAFCLAASSIYILNDLIDLNADRQHPTKKLRPLAAGTVPIFEAMIVSPVLMLAALVLASAVSLWFSAVLVSYAALSTAYSLALKRKLIVDVIVLATLYTIRVFGGAASISILVSEWLLGFSMFIFVALALIKRYVELTSLRVRDLPDPTTRNYRKTDLEIVGALAAASGFNAVTIFCLYISSDTVRHMYDRPFLLWLICPILMYWLGRALVIAHRRAMDDDPLVFALKDRNSRVAFAMILAILFTAV